MKQEHSQQQAKHKEFTKQTSVRKQLKQNSEKKWVQMFQEMQRRKVQNTPWCVPRASDMLLMSERESSDVWRNQQPAHKAPGRAEAKEPRRIQQKVGILQQRWDAHRSFTLRNSGTLKGGFTVCS